MNDQIKEAAENKATELFYNKFDAYIMNDDNLDTPCMTLERFVEVASALSLSKPEKEAYKKQISELQSKLMTERRSNAKIAKLAEKEKEWIPVMQKFIHSAYVGCTKDELWAIVKEAEDLINPK